MYIFLVIRIYWARGSKYVSALKSLLLNLWRSNLLDFEMILRKSPLLNDSHGKKKIGKKSANKYIHGGHVGYKIKDEAMI